MNNLSFWVLLVTCLSFILYFWLIHSEGPFSSLLNKISSLKSPGKAFFRRGTGVFLFSLVSIGFLLFSNLSPESVGINGSNPKETILYTLITSSLLIGLNLLTYKQESNLSMYPEIRVENWSLNIFIGSALSWIAYLFAYELLLRGVFFFVLARDLGVYPAILINISLYSIVHIPKGAKEALGAIPLGFVLCWISWSTGNIWTAIVSHCALALSNEWFSFTAQPHMKIIYRSSSDEYV